MIGLGKLDRYARREKIAKQLLAKERISVSDRNWLAHDVFNGDLRHHRGQNRAWRHVASGDLYLLHPDTPVLFREADCELLVVYRAEKEYGPSAYWSRPLSEFLEKFERVEQRTHWETV